MANIEGLTKREKKKCDQVSNRLDAILEAPGMGSSRDINTGRMVDPSILLFKCAPKNAYLEKIDAIYRSEQK
jgi:hypothetical protein